MCIANENIRFFLRYTEWAFLFDSYFSPVKAFHTFLLSGILNTNCLSKYALTMFLNANRLLFGHRTSQKPPGILIRIISQNGKKSNIVRQKLQY